VTSDGRTPPGPPGPDGPKDDAPSPDAAARPTAEPDTDAGWAEPAPAAPEAAILSDAPPVPDDTWGEAAARYAGIEMPAAPAEGVTAGVIGGEGGGGTGGETETEAEGETGAEGETETETEGETEAEGETETAAETEAEIEGGEWSAEPSADLQEAAGVAPPPGGAAKRRGGGDGNRRAIALVAAIAVLLVALLIALGVVNSRTYRFVCGADSISAEKGRGFPPWGTRRMSGPEWRPIALPASAECVDAQVDDRAALEQRYLEALVAQATAALTGGDAGAIDEAELQLMQALLFTRTPERRDERRSVERLLGDVEYSRARAEAHTLTESLEAIASKFERAGDKRPRLASDAAAWSDFLRRFADELRAGPEAMRPDPPAVADRPDRPGATARPPPHPDEPDPSPAADRPDAGPGVALPPITAPPPPPDAGVPTCGVLL
jgi:hypothetical protein